MLPGKSNNYVSKEYQARNECIKIRDSELAKIEETVMSCCLLVGINKKEHIPTGLTMGLITTFIIDYLGGYTAKEFILAFNYVASGKIEIPKEKEHFHTFSPKYLGYVMSRYSEYLSRNNLSVYKVIEEATYTPEELKEANNKAKFSIGSFIINHIVDQTFSELSPTESCYNLLKDCGYLEEQTNKEKKDMYLKFKSEYIKSLGQLSVKEKESLKDFVNNNSENEHFKNTIKNIKTYRYKAWILNNKAIDLDTFKKDFKHKINELIKQDS